MAWRARGLAEPARASQGRAEGRKEKSTGALEWKLLQRDEEVRGDEPQREYEEERGEECEGKER